MTIIPAGGRPARRHEVREGPVFDRCGDHAVLHGVRIVRDRPLPHREQATRAERDGVLDDLGQHQPRPEIRIKPQARTRGLLRLRRPAMLP